MWGNNYLIGHLTVLYLLCRIVRYILKVKDDRKKRTLSLYNVKINYSTYHMARVKEWFIMIMNWLGILFGIAHYGYLLIWYFRFVTFEKFRNLKSIRVNIWRTLLVFSIRASCPNIARDSAIITLSFLIPWGNWLKLLH